MMNKKWEIFCEELEKLKLTEVCKASLKSQFQKNGYTMAVGGGCQYLFGKSGKLIMQVFTDKGNSISRKRGDFLGTFV